MLFSAKAQIKIMMKMEVQVGLLWICLEKTAFLFLPCICQKKMAIIFKSIPKADYSKETKQTKI